MNLSTYNLTKTCTLIERNYMSHWKKMYVTQGKDLLFFHKEIHFR